MQEYFVMMTMMMMIINVIPVIIRANWKHLKFIHKVPEQHNWKARQQGSTENNHTGHSTNASQSANIKVQHDYNGK
jgi:hypothetical protein